MNMASRSLGTLTIDLIAKVGGFVEGMTKAEREADKKTRAMQRKMQQRAKEIKSAWDGISKALAAGVAGITVGAVFNNVITQTRNAEKEQALLAAALKSTGQQAGYTQGRLNDMAGAMENLTGIGAGDFNQAQTVLLGFTNIVGEQLPEALRVAADFSVRTGATMASAAETIGRALDIPSEGMKSLQRQGFKFSESQIEAARQLEKTGRIAEAQKIVIDALDETYGGAAVAARDTLGGALDALKATINSLLTGEGGSFDEMKTSINQLNHTMTAPETRAAFQTYISWMAGIAAQAVQTAAVINDAGFLSWFQVSNKEAANIHTLEATEQEVSAIIDRLKKERDELDPSKSLANKLNDWIYGDVGDKDRQIGIYESKLKGVQSRLRLLRGPENTISPVNLAPDLPVAPSGPVNLKDGVRGSKGKTQSDKDAEAAARFLDSLKQQVFQTQQKTAYEKLFFDIQHKGLKLSQQQLDEAIGLATAIDMAAEAEETRRARLEETTALYEQQNRLAAQAALYELEMSTYGMGNNAAAEMRERIQLMQQHQQELRKMQQDQALAIAGADAADIERVRAMYEQRLQMLRDTQSQELAMYDEHIAMKRQKEADWLAGISSGLQTYLENARDIYGQVQQITINAFGAAEDALVNFVRTGELDMRSMLASIGEDIVRMLVRMGMQMLANKLLGDTLQAAGVATAVAAGSATAAAWAPAAAMASLASFGANAAPASAGIASTVALSQALALAGFSDGGYTGPGGKYDVAGVVHAGEGVLSQRDMAALGGPAAFESFRKSLHGYSAGGVVGLPPVVARGHDAGQKGGDGSNVQVIIHNAPEGTRVNQRQVDDEYIVDVMLADAQSGGRFSDYYDSSRGLARIGR